MNGTRPPAPGSLEGGIEAREIKAREIVTTHVVKATDALFDVALGLDAALAYIAEGDPAHSLCQALAAQAHVASAAVQTLLDDLQCGRVRLSAANKRAGA